MAVKKLSEKEVKSYLEMLLEHGEVGFYRRCIAMGIMRLADGSKNPEIEILDLSESFFVAFRRSGEEYLFTVAKILRRSAHTLYRKLLKEETIKLNKRFLQMISNGSE